MAKIKIPIILKDGGEIPVKGTDGSAGYDLVCPENTELLDGRGLIPLNIEMAIPYGVAGIIKPRSGFTLKGFQVVDFWGHERRINCDARDGVIDSDYRKIVGVLVENEENVGKYVCKAGTRIAQILFVPVLDAEFVVVDELPATNRSGGFGSTGC